MALTMKQNNTTPLVSIIIPTFNSQKNLKGLLESIQQQTYPNIETIVIDRHSTDGTVETARKFKAKVYLLKAERSKAKNYGARKARGEFLLFLDSDMKPTPKLVQECVERTRTENVDALIIPELSKGNNALARCKKLEKAALEKTRGEKASFCIPRFFRKNVFLALGGFNEKLVFGEDFDFYERFKKAGYKTGKTRSIILHYESSSLRKTVLKAYYYGETISPLIQSHPSNTFKRHWHMNTARLKLIFTWKASPLLLAVFLIAKITEYFAYTLGILTGLISKTFNKKALKHALLTARLQIPLHFLLLTLIAVLIFRNFLFTSYWPAGNDILGWISRVYIFGREYRWLRLWRPHSFGFVENINLIDLFLMLAHSLFKDPFVTIKMFLFLSFLIAGVSMYAFAYNYTRKPLAAFSASLVYVLNQWLFSQLTEGHLQIIFSYALAPLVFLSVDKALETGKFKTIILASFALSLLVMGFHPNSAVIYGVFLLLFFFFHLAFSSKHRKSRVHVKRFLKTTFSLALLVFLFTLPVTLPFMMGSTAYFFSPEYKYHIEEAESFSLNITDTFILKADEHGGYIRVLDVREDFDVPDFPVSEILTFIFTLAYCTVLIRKDKYTLFFLTSTVISVFLAKGTNSPLGFVFTWAWFNVPYFAVFRRPSRWEMMTAFSNAFFIALLTATLIDYLKRQQGDKEITLEIRTRGNPREKERELRISISLKRAAEALRKLLRFLAVSFLILIFVSGYLSCFFFFHQGLLVNVFPEEYLQPYEWLSQQEGNFKIVTVNKSPSEWLEQPGAKTDFCFCRMLAETGWYHDLGFDSSFIHDKPVLQDGGWTPSSRSFVDYLRLSVVREKTTKNLLKVLGAFGYKYIVIPSYASQEAAEFFLNQKGATVVRNETDATILRNAYYNAPFSLVNSQSLVVGGFQSLLSLSKIDSFKFNETALLFAHELDSLDELLGSPNTRTVIFTDGTPIDLAMLSLKDEAKLIFAAKYGVPSFNYTRYWAPAPFWRNLGHLVLGKKTLTTKGETKVDIPFKVDTSGCYSVWLRLGFGTERGTLKVSIDHLPIAEFAPFASHHTRLKWVNLTNLELQRGEHTLSLSNDGEGYNDVDAIMIVRPETFQSKLNEIIKKLETFHGRIVYLVETENFFNQDAATQQTYVFPYEGTVLELENAATNVASEGKATASSTQIKDYKTLKAEYAADGNYATRWASKPYEPPPQWLTLEWASPKEIIGVKINFETAYAKNYLLQVWNKTGWTTIVNKTENTSFSPLHIFEKPVNATKLRLNVTEFSDFPLVSIWELEVFEKSTSVSTKLFIPKSGEYKIALRTVCGKDYGKLFFKLDNEAFSVDCRGSSSPLFKWQTLGPVSLSKGEHELRLGSIGKAVIDTIVLYSSEDSEEPPSLSKVFEVQPSNNTVLNFRKIDPCTYRVSAKLVEPSLLVFSESYNPLWKAYVNGNEVSPLKTYSLVNGFPISETGTLEITIRFKGQMYADLGLYLSFTSFLSATVFLLLPLNKVKRLFRKRRRLPPVLAF